MEEGFRMIYAIIEGTDVLQATFVPPEQQHRALEYLTQDLGAPGNWAPLPEGFTQPPPIPMPPITGEVVAVAWDKANHQWVKTLRPAL